MNLQACLKKYIDSCEKHGVETVKSENYRAINKAYESIMKNFRVLIADDLGKTMLKELLNSDNIYVSSWTATLLVFEYPNECEKVLNQIIKGKGIWAGTIRTFNEEWKAGRIEKMY